MDTTHFWELRARQFAAEGAGLAAVCSYAMPDFYNWGIDVTQRASLARLLDSIPPGAEVLDYGCGIGRWSRELARRGARVTAIDVSSTMLEQAKRRTALAGLTSLCRFLEADVTRLELDSRFDVIIGVTVLQHVLGEAVLQGAVSRLARHLKPGGRLIMVEAAPSHATARCNTATFSARTYQDYVTALRAADLSVVAVHGVDPVPLKLWIVPRFRRWPRWFGLSALSVATLVSVPLDLLLAPWLARHSWHKIIVARKPVPAQLTARNRAGAVASDPPAHGGGGAVPGGSS